MSLNVYVPQVQRIGGVVWYLRGHLGQRFASTAAVVPNCYTSGISLHRHYVPEQCLS